VAAYLTGVETLALLVARRVLATPLHLFTFSYHLTDPLLPPDIILGDILK
jgi:hypothetical protein